MNITTVSQPETQLGDQIDVLLNEDVSYTRIVFVSAFVALRTILNLRERLLENTNNVTDLRFRVGIDLGGTTREVLEELLRWNCETIVIHNSITRSTFHPKLYLFEGHSNAVFFIGSNNLTNGGFYTNYEAATRFDFKFPNDTAEYERLIAPLMPFLEPTGPIAQRLSAELIETLVARGELPSESDQRHQRRSQARAQTRNGQDIPQNPFGAVSIPLPPLLPETLRRELPRIAESQQPVQVEPPATRGFSEPSQTKNSTPFTGILVWRKTLPQSDALQVNEGSHHVGGVRLTQARFENPPGHRIDQTTYFRRIFADYSWDAEPRRSNNQEHTFVPMRIIIRGRDYGVRNFEISHKPSGEAGQANYTTILRWGREFNPIVLQENLTGAVFSLYEIGEGNADFLIEISDL